MAVAPRSQRLIGYVSTGQGSSPLWTSPAGFITLVKSAHIWNEGTTASSVTLVFAGPGFTPHIYLPLGSIAANTHVEWNGWFVLNPGDEAVFTTTTAQVHVWLSGAVLAGAPQFPSS